MAFEWDERKRLTNLAKHGVDFRRAKLIFDGAVLEGPDDRRDYVEDRIGAYGVVDGELLFIVYTWRGTTRRLITARRTGRHEREAYFARVAQDDSGK